MKSTMKPNIAYLDTPSGISGDMFLGCLVNAGWPITALQETIQQLGIAPELWHIEAESVMRGPLSATLVHVQVVEEHHHRHLHHIQEIIQNSALPESVQNRALAVFTRLAQAEAAVHGTTVEEIHFHEVGALDAIIDIVGVCAGLHALGIEQLYASGLPMGHGWTNSEHGRIPLPAPATLALLSAVQAPNRPAPGPGELVTPTGAALLAELAIFTQPALSLDRIGLGAGQKEFEWPNIARLWLAHADDVPSELPQLIELETNIDDMNPEFYPAIQNTLLAAGARDVWITPIQMKKGRPGVLLSVLAEPDQEEMLASLLLQETTTLGVRVHPVRRHEAERSIVTVACTYGKARVKLKWLDGVVQGAQPEYEDCLALAQDQGVPVRMVYEAVLLAAKNY